MTHLDIPNWLAPAVLVAIGGIGSLVKMWAAVQQSGQHQADQDRQHAELKARVDAHDTRIGTIESTLSAILAGIEWLKAAITSQPHK